jgi:redox-sensitive bicupin YhaK (pirin superfamily)
MRSATPRHRTPAWTLLASPDGRDGSLAIRQDARVHGVRLAAGESVELALDPARRYWLHVALGAVVAGERSLSAGDALGFVAESGTLRLRGNGDGVADVLLFDLPAQ